jgi:hypothetical protein
MRASGDLEQAATARGHACSSAVAQSLHEPMAEGLLDPRSTDLEAGSPPLDRRQETQHP